MNRNDEVVFEVTEEYTSRVDGTARQDSLREFHTKENALDFANKCAAEMRKTPDAEKSQRVIFVRTVHTAKRSGSTQQQRPELILALSVD